MVNKPPQGEHQWPLPGGSSLTMSTVLLILNPIFLWDPTDGLFLNVLFITLSEKRSHLPARFQAAKGQTNFYSGSMFRFYFGPFKTSIFVVTLVNSD
jgi:hypothetical protein